jgi:hypothetical protein
MDEIFRRSLALIAGWFPGAGSLSSTVCKRAITADFTLGGRQSKVFE